MNELIPFKNWVVTYPHDKVPLNPYTGQKADVTDPATWGDFATADACVSMNKHLLLGFVLTNTPFSCLDLDTYKTNDPAIIEFHKGLYEWFHTYSELSPSYGVHLWCIGKLGIDGKRMPQQFVEVYCSRRYIIITRQSLNGRRIEDRQQLLEEYVNWATQQIRAQVIQPNSSPEVATDNEVCTMAANAFNGELFRELYVGNWQSRYPTQSEADQAFVNIVAFYTDSKEQVGRIFHNSELGKRKKAHRQDYLYHPQWGIITRAFDQKLPNVSFADIENLVRAKVNDDALQAIAAPVPGFTPSPEEREIIKKIERLPEFLTDELDMAFNDFPVGLTGDIAKFIFRNGVRPVKEIAIAGAIAFMAALCGKFYNISEMGLNHYIIIVAPTGTGKEGANDGIERLISFAKEKLPTIENFIGPEDIASPQALIRHLAEDRGAHTCCMSRKGEMGFWLRRICAERANANDLGLRRALLQLYTSSGRGKIYRKSIYADKNKDSPEIKSPAFSVLGDSTPEIFYSALDEDQLDQGLISRFLVMECDANAEFNILHGKIDPDPSLVDRICGIAKYVMAGHQADLVKDIDLTKDANQYLDEFRMECDNKRKENPKSPEAIVYTRGCERLLRLAGLIAVGVNPDHPVVTTDIALWAKKMILRTMTCVILKFEHGEVGNANLYLEQRKVMIQIIKRYWKAGYSPYLLERHNINEEMFNWKIVTRRFLRAKISSCPAFRKSRNMKMDFENACLDLVKDGILIGPIEMGKVRGSMRTGVAYYIHDFTLLEDD